MPLLRAAALALPACLAASVAWAVLQEDDDAPPPPTPTTSICKDGKVWDDVTSTCVDPETGALDDDRLYAAGRELAYAGRYAEAGRVFAALRDPDAPRALAARGYVARKSGRTGEGLALYAAALEADPDLLLARAYLGMHHVERDELVEARAQLLEIEARGGAGSWPHAALRDAIMGVPVGY